MVVIVGGGFAGLETAIKIRALRSSCEVTLISARPSLVYKPWLIYVPAGRRRFAEVCLPLAPMARRHGFQLIEGRVDRVDLEAQHVHLTGGHTIDYLQLVIATGAEADRGRIPGAETNALFPCDPDDADKFAHEIQARKASSICVAVGWDRRGPGLEFAGWLAARRRQLGLPDLEVVIVDGDGLMTDRYGAAAAAAYREILTRRGATFHPEPRLDSVTESGAVINDKARYFDLAAIVSPARGVDIGLPAEMLDDHGFVKVGNTFETPRPGVFAFGDGASPPSSLEVSKTMVSIRQRVDHFARNVLARMDGQPLSPAGPSTGSHYAMSNLGGTALLLKDNQVARKGRLPLFQRWLYDQSYFRIRS